MLESVAWDLLYAQMRTTWFEDPELDRVVCEAIARLPTGKVIERPVKHVATPKTMDITSQTYFNEFIEQHGKDAVSDTLKTITRLSKTSVSGRFLNTLCVNSSGQPFGSFHRYKHDGTWSLCERTDDNAWVFHKVTVDEKKKSEVWSLEPIAHPELIDEFFINQEYRKQVDTYTKSYFDVFARDALCTFEGRDISLRQIRAYHWLEENGVIMYAERKYKEIRTAMPKKSKKRPAAHQTTNTSKKRPATCLDQMPSCPPAKKRRLS